MNHTRQTVLFSLLVFSLLAANFGNAQAPRSGIVGHVTDAAGAVIQRARVELQPGATVASTDDDGNFTISGVVPGIYTLTISNVGFSIFSTRVTVPNSRPIRVDAVLRLGTQNEEVTVHADRE